MAKLITQPTEITAAGNKPKKIREYIGLVNSANSEISIAKMNSPKGWEEPGQTPEFNEYTLVLKGCLVVRTRNEEFHVKEGQAIRVQKDEWVQYSTPFEGGAEYVAVCLPAFSPETVHRDLH